MEPAPRQWRSAAALAEPGGGSHDKLKHDARRRGVIIVVPRHRTLSPGVARSIATLAGWTRWI